MARKMFEKAGLIPGLQAGPKQQTDVAIGVGRVVRHVLLRSAVLGWLQAIHAVSDLELHVPLEAETVGDVVEHAFGVIHFRVGHCSPFL